MTVTAGSIAVDGAIDLVDIAAPGDFAPATDGDAERARRSRLADVMIVLERERDDLEARLRARLEQEVLVDGIAEFALHLDDTAPQFSVELRPTANDEGATGALSRDQRARLEGEIAAGVRALIEQRSAPSQAPRWQPQVVAVYRTAAPEPPAHRAPHKSVWLHILFWLLACMVLATAYLFLKDAT